MILLAVCLASVVTTAWAQPRPHYADMYEGNKQVGKQWASSSGHLRVERLQPDGSNTIIIYRADSVKVYALRPDRKTYMVVPFSQATNMNALIGAKVESGRTTTREELGRERVGIYDCKVYRVTTSSTLADGTTKTGIRKEWWWEPLNTFIKSDIPDFDLRNIVQGEQPADLFAIPRDYAVIAIPSGGLMDMFRQTSGRSQSDLQDAKRDADKQVDRIRDIQNDAKTQDLIKQLESALGGGKK